MTSAKLFILGEERELLWINTNYYRNTASNGSPKTYTEGGLLSLGFASQENDCIFLDNMTKGVKEETDRMEKGEIHFYNKGDRDSPIRKYKFSDAYLVAFSEVFDSCGTENMQIALTISPAIQNYGNGKEFIKYWQVSWVPPSEPVYYIPKAEEEERIVYINGHFYNKNGTFEGKIDDPSFEGSIEDVYVCDGKSTQKDKNGNEGLTYNNTKLLKENDVNVIHKDFQRICNIVKNEGLSSEENEYIFIAHANYNEGKHKKTTMLARLMTGYSSVDKNDKLTPLSDTAIDSFSKYSRKGVIDSLLREIDTEKNDPTEGARFWDGVDFLAWGIDTEFKADSQFKTGHNKFDEYDSIKIKKSLYDKFVEKIKEKYPNGAAYKSSHNLETDKGSHTHKETKKVSRAVYTIPASDFDREEYWITGDFLYKNILKRNTSIVATQVAGYSIFWKEIK